MNKRLIKFAILGSSGFIARRHVSVVKSLKQELILAYDTFNNSGYLDAYFSKCYFSKNIKEFFSLVKKKKISYVIICTPNYLHFQHIKKSLLNGANVICEKPTVLNIVELKKIIEIEKKTNKKCYSLFQLRYNKDLMRIKFNYLKSQNKKNTLNLNYITYRGSWYDASWKNNPKLSGGLIMNIGIHFVDILTYLFGNLDTIYLSKKTKKTLKGKMYFGNTIVNFLLSIEKKYLKKINQPIRQIVLNNSNINLTKKFQNLHKKCYQEILANKGILIKNLIPTFNNLKTIQNEIKK